MTGRDSHPREWNKPRPAVNVSLRTGGYAVLIGTDELLVQGVSEYLAETVANTFNRLAQESALPCRARVIKS